MPSIRSVNRALATLVSLSVLGFFATPASGQPVVVGSFSGATPLGMPDGWEPLRFPSVAQETAYTLEEQGERVSLRAHSIASASALTTRVTVDLETHPYLSWSWSTDPRCVVGDWAHRANDDFPLRLFVLFDRPGGWLSFFRKVGAHVSRDIFGTAVMYVSEPARPPETRQSHLSDRIRVISVGTSPTETRHHVRNVREDYIELFGREPPNVRAVAVMTDTDNSGTECTSYFGDIVFSELLE